MCRHLCCRRPPYLEWGCLRSHIQEPGAYPLHYLPESMCIQGFNPLKCRWMGFLVASNVKHPSSSVATCIDFSVFSLLVSCMISPSFLKVPIPCILRSMSIEGLGSSFTTWFSLVIVSRRGKLESSDRIEPDFVSKTELESALISNPNLVPSFEGKSNEEEVSP